MSKALTMISGSASTAPFFYTSASPESNLSSNTTLPAPVTGNIIIALIVEVIIFGLVSGNLLIVTAIALYKQWTVADALLFSLSIADLINGAIPLQVLNVINNFLRPNLWPFSLCTVYLIVTYTLRMASVCTITIIAVERALMLTKPLEHMTRVTVSRMKKLLLIVWVFSLLLSIFPLIGVGRHGFHNGFCRYQLYDLGMAYGCLIEALGIVQLLIVLGCFVVIKFTTGRFIKRQNIMSAASQIGNRGSIKKAQDSAGAKQVKQLAKLMGVVVVLYYVSWLPYLMVNLVSLVKEKPESSSEVVIAGLFSLVNGLINPILYGKMSTRYGRGYYFVLRKVASLCGKTKPEGDFFETNRKGSAVYNTSVASIGSLKRQNNNTGASAAFTNYACSVNDTDEVKIHCKTTKTAMHGSSPLTQELSSSKKLTVTFKNESAKSEHFSTASKHLPNTKQVYTSSDFVLAEPRRALISDIHEISEKTDWSGCSSSVLSNLSKLEHQSSRNQQLSSNDQSKKTTRMENSCIDGTNKQFTMDVEWKEERVEIGECSTHMTVSINDAENESVNTDRGRSYFEKMEATTDIYDTRL